MAPGNPDVTSRYLSLALFAQRMIDILTDCLYDGRCGQLHSAVQEAVNDLKTAASQAQAFTGAVPSFYNYENLRTVTEALAGGQMAELTSILDRFANSGFDPALNRADAERAIDLFYELESQALWNFEQPTAAAAHPLRQLCQP